MRILLLLPIAVLFTACGSNEPPVSQELAASTQDVAIYNFHQVDPGLYRSGELTPASVKVLAEKYGIKTIVSLDAYTFNSEGKQKEISAAMQYGLSFIWAPLNPVGELDTKKVLNITTRLETLPRPLIFHCYRGSERTGIVAATYRIKHGWSFKDAFSEADLYGFSPLFNGWKHDMQKILNSSHN